MARLRSRISLLSPIVRSRTGIRNRNTMIVQFIRSTVALLVVHHQGALFDL